LFEVNAAGEFLLYFAPSGRGVAVLHGGGDPGGHGAEVALMPNRIKEWHRIARLMLV
jgi:hypothetical protein